MRKVAILFGIWVLGLTWFDDSVLASSSKETWSEY